MGLSSDFLIFDGGMGTELYERGFYINRPFEELNINAPADVIAVHESYIQAGAGVLTTNTFSITEPQLKKFDIESQQEMLIRAALKNAGIARTKNETAHPGVKVGLSIGPLGVLVEPLGSYALSNAKTDFAKVAQSAASASKEDVKTFGFDLYILETFSNLSELAAAIDGIRSVDTVRPILASLSVKSTQNELISGFAARIGSRTDVEYLGLNCSEGPSDLLASLTKLAPLVSKPIIVQPNAGTPRQLNGRYFYMTSPDYLGKYAKRFIEAGASGVGGCCGTGPDHIRAIRSTVKMMAAKRTETPARIHVEAGNVEVPRTPITARAASNIGKALREGRKIYSVEMLPPKGTDTRKFLEDAALVVNAGIDFINAPDSARAITRVGSLHIAALVENQFKGKLHAIPHFTTRDRNLIALQSDLLGAFINGVSDILLVTGDPPKLGNNREATAVYDIDAIGLTYLADCLNRGVSPNGDSLGRGTGFGIGVASNPTSMNLELEVKRWKYKVESGADFAITQPIFDPESYLAWKKILGKDYRPHVVGIWPLVSLRNAEFMANEVPGVNVPDWVLTEMEKAGDNKEEALKRGIDIAIRVMRELESECEGFCVSAPLGKTPVALDALRAIGAGR